MHHSTTYTPSIVIHYCFFKSLVVKCITIDTYYGRTQVKIIHTTREQKQKETPFSMARQALLVGTWMVGDGWRGDTFLITPQSIKALSSIGLQGQPGQWTNDKATSWGTTSSIGHKFGIHFSHVRRQSSCDPFWQNTIAIKEWRAHITPTIISKLCILFIFPSQHEWIVQTKVMGLHSS